jgi:nucleotidyltransferase AbiEii toxin of type IV toxin-antitoxin system
MDVTRVLGLVRPFFEKRGEPFAVVGGLALLAYGAPRATFDVDLLVPRGVRDDLVAFLEGCHFATLSVQAGFSNHQHVEPALGRLDVVYVSGATADAVFAGCVDRMLAPGVKVPVPRPEHLVAMKVQAFAKDRTRYSDLTDLQFLLSIPGLDQAQARSYFESAGLSDYYEQLRRR